MNRDPSSQFTGIEWTLALKDAGVKRSTDGKGRWIDKRLIEGPWRSLKYECVYLNGLETGAEARAGIGKGLSNYKVNADIRLT